ncbi:MAG: ABC transporter ATP-binding protein, partial [Oscillospiraceae bacterium]|nr:ABC transporter ATP-binding protein [Oscillospiraceae bacterium]
MNGESVLSARALSAGYGRSVIVSGVSFEIRGGEILTLIGANGAGKSTVLRTIAAQLPAVSGSVFLGQSRLAELSETEIARQMSVLLTERIRTERMTCEEVVETGRYPYTGRLGILSKADHRIVEEAMALAGVT